MCPEKEVSSKRLRSLRKVDNHSYLVIWNIYQVFILHDLLDQLRKSLSFFTNSRDPVTFNGGNCLRGSTRTLTARPYGFLKILRLNCDEFFSVFDLFVSNCRFPFFRLLHQLPLLHILDWDAKFETSPSLNFIWISDKLGSIDVFLDGCIFASLVIAILLELFLVLEIISPDSILVPFSDLVTIYDRPFNSTCLASFSRLSDLRIALTHCSLCFW